MNKKIEKPNYTQIPNVYFDEIMQTLNQTENIVFLVIMRKTFGWHKKRDKISYSQIMSLSGIKSRTTVSTALKGLLEKGLIETQKAGQLISYTVSINEPVQKIDQSKFCTGTSPNSVLVEPKTSPNSVHTKEIDINKLSKEIYSEIESAYIDAFKEVIPDGEPIIDYKKTRAREKALLSKLGKDKIIQAINAAKKDDWIISGGFSLMVILGDYQLNKLLNGKQQKHGYSKPLPVQTRTAFLDMED